MYPEELRVAINEYLDKGVDFVKYGGTSHWAFPTLISFSPEAQRVIVEETHARGLIAEIHSTNPEGLRLSIEAGIDLIQHPEVLPMIQSPTGTIPFRCVPLPTESTPRHVVVPDDAGPACRRY